jgi:glycosyltransferase involved in cell wall biosynthesis
MLKKHGTNVVLAVFPYDVYLVATVRAARRLGLPVYLLMNDLWMEMCTAGTAEARFAQRCEPVILKQATRVLCVTEAMRHYYEKKYGIRTALMPHCVPEKDFLGAPPTVRPPRMPRPTVLFVGGINDGMNVEALRVLASASELLPQDYELHFSTPSDLGGLKRLGISSSRLRVSYVSRAEARQLEAEAHVLVAPLSHNGCSRDQVRTILSSKLLSYFISGRPIVVFAPEDSYQAESARKNGWGYVVTSNSAAVLAQAIEKVATDQDLAAKVVRGALQEAERRRAKVHAQRLHEWVQADAVLASTSQGPK